MSEPHPHIRVYERSHIYPQYISFYLDLFSFSPQENEYIANYWEVFGTRSHYLLWARDVNLLEQAFRRWFIGWLSDSQKKREIIQFYERHHRELPQEYTRLKQKNFDTRTPHELREAYDTVIQLTLRHIAYAEYTSDLFDDFYTPLFREFLLSKGYTVSTGDVSILLQPATLSMSAQYRRFILEQSLQDEKTVLDEDIERFSWIRMSWNGEHELTQTDVIKDIDELRHIGEKIRRMELESIVYLPEKVQHERKRISEIYHFDESIEPYFELLDIFNVFHDYRKEIQMRANQIMHRLLHAIARTCAIDHDDLVYYFNDEVRALLDKKIRVEQKILEQRKIGIVWLIEEGKITNYFGEKAYEVIDQLIINPRKAADVSELRGLSVSRGMYTGKVFVATSAENANKDMQQGDVLVTSMTTVDYIPAMRKAGAVITDDGGATCHAAIVSREFGIPCIVGTKVATQVLKTGDIVDVDANKGIIVIF